MYGHPGAKKCIKLLQEHFTIDGMLKKVKNYVRTCDMCQKRKDAGNKVLFGGTKAIIPLRKGDLVSADYFGPLPVSSAGVRYLFVIVDNFTKYVRLFTLRRATTAATLRRIHQYCKELGCPRIIITDNGTQFTSRKWLDGLNELNIQPRFTAIRNPCANLAERINRQLGNLFRIFVCDQHTKWSRYVPIIESCINKTLSLIHI